MSSPKETTKEVSKAVFSAVIDVSCVVLLGAFAYKALKGMKGWIERS